MVYISFFLLFFDKRTINQNWQKNIIVMSRQKINKIKIFVNNL